VVSRGRWVVSRVRWVVSRGRLGGLQREIGGVQRENGGLQREAGLFEEKYPFPTSGSENWHNNMESEVVPVLALMARGAVGV
jgi:hypothetical protein